VNLILTKKLATKKEAIKENPEISNKDQEYLNNKFLKKLKRTGVKHEGTLYSYLRYAEYICEELDTEITNIKEQHIEKLSDEVISNIEKSVYKRGPGDLAKRNKNKAYLTWIRLLSYQGLSTDDIPEVSFKSNKDNVDVQADTSPEDLPTPDEFKDFLHNLGKYSSDKVADRNQAIVALIWDAGTRIGETLPIKMKQISVQGDRLHIQIEGNKSSKDRRIEIFQNKKLLTEYISGHPKRNSPEAYLFPKLKEEKYFQYLDKKPLRRKVHQAAAELDFKTSGEPFHIFRKAMSTYYVVNDILSWEEVCERQGKSPDGTMPTYLKMAMEDIDSSAAEGFGLDTQQRENDHRMKAPPLLPQQCESCRKTNPGYRNTCIKCQSTLPKADMPTGNNILSKEEQEKEQIKAQLKNVLNILEQTGLDLDVEDMI